MKKIALILFSFSVASFSIQPFTYYWTVKTSGDTATVYKMRYNYDSILNWSTRMCDTTNNKLVRWSIFNGHDSTFKWMNIDTIPSSDSIYVKNLKALKIDSVYSAKGIKGTSGTFSTSITVTNNITTDSIKARAFKGSFYRDSVNTPMVRSTVGNFDTINVNNLLDTSVKQDTFHLAFTFGFTSTVKMLCSYKITYPKILNDSIVKIVDVYMKRISSVSNGVPFNTAPGALPSIIRPTSFTCIPVCVFDSGGVIRNGQVGFLTDGTVAFARQFNDTLGTSYTGFQSTLNKGTFDTKVSYIIRK